MAALTWKRVHKYRWQCKESPSLSISAALVQSDPVYTLWQGDTPIEYATEAATLRESVNSQNLPTPAAPIKICN